MKSSTYIHLPDIVREKAERLVDAGMFGNMSELIREAVRHFVEEKKLSDMELAIELYKKDKISLGKAAAKLPRPLPRNGKRCQSSKVARAAASRPSQARS